MYSGARCLSCHNDQDREGGFSLSDRSDARKERRLIAGDPKASRLFQSLLADAEERMPMGGPPLDERELETIRRWIVAGARWPEGATLDAVGPDSQWWSYRPVTRPTPPLADSASANPIDAFVARKLRERGLSPSPEADRRTLLRRLSFDLTGLPPNQRAVDDFVRDRDPLAYQRCVDRLLASPRYGERWARHWLDVVQYADTHGYDKDKPRPNAWPYRDYVVRSLNQDKPYSRFVLEQLAGDSLDSSSDAITALGFLAAGPWDFIGHVEVPESKLDGKVARNLDRDNYVANVFNTFCSTTVQCGRCHDHKFDPITQQQYYELQAIFAAIDRADRDYDTDPKIAARRATLQAELSRWQAESLRLEQQVIAKAGPLLADLEREIRRLADRADVVKANAFGYHSQIAGDEYASKWVELRLASPARVEQVVLHPCHDDFAGIGAGFGFPLRLRVEVAGDGPWIEVYDRRQADLPNPGLAELRAPVTTGVEVRRVRVTATRLAHRKNDYIFALAEVRVLNAEGENLAAGAEVIARDSIEASPRWSRRNLTDGKWPKYSDPDAAQRLADARKQHDILRAGAETSSWREQSRRVAQGVRATESAIDRLPETSKVYAATTQFAAQGSFRPTGGERRSIRLLHRGDVSTPGPLVSPSLPDFGDYPGGVLDADRHEREQRLELAEWLIHPEHPLTWRSIVNRVWQHHFGEGLVATPNDFGRMGAPPSHPELLDWLARRFLDDGQSLKRLHRWIATSRTYRQESRVNPAAAKVDSDNRWLWTMRRRRLDAEEVRDASLEASGSLINRVGGPGFYLFALEQTQHSPHYQYHKFDPADPASHRRSIYRFVVRSQPDPWMTPLDCADSSASTPRRAETLTPLQALVLSNSAFSLEMAERFATRLRAMRSPRQQIHTAFAIAFQRRADGTGREGATGLRCGTRTRKSLPSDPEPERVHVRGLTNYSRLLNAISATPPTPKSNPMPMRSEGSAIGPFGEDLIDAHSE